MLRRLLSHHQNRLIFRRASSNDNSQAPLTLNAYHEASDNKLEELNDKLESVLEERYDQGSDVSLNNGVLTVTVDEQNTYVINKQTPNRQLWLSSPISGPKRFDLVGGKWVDKHSQIQLESILSKELSDLLKSKVDV